MIAMTAPPPTPDAATRHRVWIDYAVEGDLRFLSHHDEIRALTRAIVRARWPLAYSAGFNPAPRLSIPLPRAVGVAADAQRAAVELSTLGTLETLHSALADTLPEGLPLRHIMAAPQGRKPHATAVEYVAELTTDECSAVTPRIAALLSAASRIVARTDRDGRERGNIDVRPSIVALCIENQTLRIGLRLDDGPVARPHEVLAELGFVPNASIHRLRRTAVTWD